MLAAGDVYLMPSVWETFGLAGVEASMAGLPIVASDLLVLREVVPPEDPLPEGGSVVRFHPLRDAAGLANAVTALLVDYPHAADRGAWATGQVGRHGRRTMIAGYLRLLAAPGRSR